LRSPSGSGDDPPCLTAERAASALSVPMAAGAVIARAVGGHENGRGPGSARLAHELLGGLACDAPGAPLVIADLDGLASAMGLPRASAGSGTLRRPPPISDPLSTATPAVASAHV